MDVQIQERSFSFGVKYDIELPAGTWTATKKIFTLLTEIEVHDSASELLATLNGEFSLLPNYRFTLSVGRTYEYSCVKMWKGVYDCIGNGESFRLYSHKGLHYSIFQNDVQIAAITQDGVTLGDGNTYDMRVNRNANILILVCMVLTLNTMNGDDTNNSTVNFNLGNIGPEDRPFDTSWRPIDEAADFS